MNLTRHNYEEYFLLYIDNELGEEECRWVEQFAKENPDLAKELRAFQDTVMDREEVLSFGDKHLLYKEELTDNAVISSRVIPLWKKVVAAAAVLLLLGAGAFWFLRESGAHEHSGPAGNAAGALATTAPATNPAETAATTTAAKPTETTAPANPTIPNITKIKGIKRVGRTTGGATPVTDSSVPTNTIAAANPTIATNIGTPIPGVDPNALATTTTPGTGNVSATANISATVEPATIATSADKTIAVSNQNIPTPVTIAHAASYHTLEDADQKDDGNKILFVRSEQVLNGGVKGLFRKASRVLKHSTTLSSDNIHPETDSDK